MEGRLGEDFFDLHRLAIFFQLFFQSQRDVK